MSKYKGYYLYFNKSLVKMSSDPLLRGPLLLIRTDVFNYYFCFILYSFYLKHRPVRREGATDPGGIYIEELGGERHGGRIIPPPMSFP